MFTSCRLMLACAALALLPMPSSQAQDAKPAIRGLISMGAYRFVGAGGHPNNTLAPLDKKPGIFSGIVIVATWNQLQSTPGATIGDDNFIDQALAKVRAYNKRNPQKPLKVKLRIWGGFKAPHWAKSIGGAPIKTVHNGKTRTIGRFWSPAYRHAWAALQQQLAARFDDEPLIREVAVTSCMSYTAEPFFVPVTEPSVMNPLLAAGFKGAAYRFCLTNAVGDYAAWTRSRLVLAVNPLRTDSSPGPGDAAFTQQVMLACRQAIGVRCAFDNHDLDSNLAKPLLPIYAYMKELGPEIEFQTFCATPSKFQATIERGIQYGASAIELYQDYGGFPYVPNGKLKQWATMIENNKPGTAPPSSVGLTTAASPSCPKPPQPGSSEVVQ
jgi:hypothetical protein